MTAERALVGEVLHLNRVAIEPDPQVEYTAIGVRSFGKGIFHYEPKPGDQKKVQDIAAHANKPTAWIEPDSKQPLTFNTVGQSQPTTLVPLNRVIHERYAVYWKVDNKTT